MNTFGFSARHIDLMQLHIDALFSRNARGDLHRVNEPDGGIAPRFFLGMTSDGPVLRFRHDVDPTTREELEKGAFAAAFERRVTPGPIDPHAYETILARSAPIANTWTGPAFAFPEALPSNEPVVRIHENNSSCLQPLLRGWITDIARCQPIFARIVDDRAVAVCCSVRQTDRAHEAGVETAIVARGRGYAVSVVGAWARAVREDARVPLYSTSWQNTPSRSLAQKLNLLPFGSDLHIT